MDGAELPGQDDLEDGATEIRDGEGDSQGHATEEPGAELRALWPQPLHPAWR